MTTKGGQPWIIGALAFALAMAGCAGAGSSLQSVPAAARGAGSWLNPATTAQNLLYISDDAHNAVDVFTFPLGTKTGVLQQLHEPAGICSDKAGEVWVVNAPNHVLKYDTAAKSRSRRSRTPTHCAFKPAPSILLPDDLAVTDAGRAGEAGSVVVYTGGQGPPRRFRSADLSDVFFCAYDDKGNLFVDGLDGGYRFHLVELPHGGQRLQAVRDRSERRVPRRGCMGRQVSRARRPFASGRSLAGDLSDFRYCVARDGRRHHHTP